MPLIDLKTNLKDLKFGRDERGGGSSNQPYVVTKIPAANENSPTGFLGIPLSGAGDADFIIRGGTLLPNSIINDEIRLGKFFASTEGVLFTIKQNLLSRIAVKTQASPRLLNGDVYTPLSTLTQAAVLPFGTHVNKQGLNPFAGIGGGYPSNEYFSVIREEINESNTQNINKFNRLVGLYDNILINNTSVNNFNFQGMSLNDGVNILSYSGGPNSILGIGKTNIRFATDNIGSPLLTQKTLTSNYNNVGYSTLTYKQINEIAEEAFDIKYPNVVDFRDKLKEQLKQNNKTTLISNSPSYIEGGGKNRIEQRVNLGDPGNNTEKNLRSYVSGSGGIGNIPLGAASNKSYDKINSLPIYKSDSPNKKEGNDLVKFRIGVLDTNNPGGGKIYIHFRAFLDQISDNYSSTWDSIKYIGRGENFYTYNGFDRKVSLGWTVAAQSKAELIPMYKKLNYLASLCAPDYSENGYMRGNIVTLTIGGYFYEQPGIITSLNYEMNDENSTWEIGINDNGGDDSTVKELPHLIRVTGFNFIPIHTFVPRKQGGDIMNKNILPIDPNRYGPERYIALTNGSSINYNEPIPSLKPLPGFVPSNISFPETLNQNFLDTISNTSNNLA
jgi:hypothetical protein